MDAFITDCKITGLVVNLVMQFCDFYESIIGNVASHAAICWVIHRPMCISGIPLSGDYDPISHSHDISGFFS